MEEIFILRHAHAEDITEGQPAGNDFDRKLTEEGIEKTKKLSNFFKRLKEETDIILSSPYRRAKETAEIFANNLGTTIALKTADFLSSGASSKDIVKGLLPYSSYKKILLVGHAPDLEHFLGKLIGAERIKLKKTSMAKVSLSNNIELSGELIWLITPKIASKIKVKDIKEKV